MFDDIKNYVNFNNTKKTCSLCNDGRPLRTYTTCDGCKRFFCMSHRPVFATQWFCPICESRFKSFVEPLKTADTDEFFRRLA